MKDFTKSNLLSGWERSLFLLSAKITDKRLSSPHIMRSLKALADPNSYLYRFTDWSGTWFQEVLNVYWIDGWMDGEVNGRGQIWKGVTIRGRWKDTWLEGMGWVDGGVGVWRDCWMGNEWMDGRGRKGRVLESQVGGRTGEQRQEREHNGQVSG